MGSKDEPLKYSTTIQTERDKSMTIICGPQPFNKTDQKRNNLTDLTTEFVKSKLECYNMNHISRGRCIIISHTKFASTNKTNKTGTLSYGNRDAKDLAECLKGSLGFGVKNIQIYTDGKESDDFYKPFQRHEVSTQSKFALRYKSR